MTAPRIDIHAHVVFEALAGLAGEHGPEQLEGEQPRYRAGGYVLEGVRYSGTIFTDFDVRLAAMDAAGIDRQVLSPNPLTYFHNIPAERAAAFCRRGNDLMAEAVARHPDRLLGSAALPLQDVDAALAELDRAVRELGLVGPYIGSELGGRTLDDPAFDPFYEALVDLDVPLFVHPCPDGIDRPVRDERRARWDLDLLLGFAYDETLAVAALVYGGVFERHPDLDVCISHGGGAAPYLFGRMAAAATKRRWSPERLRQPGAFADELRHIWYDCHVHDERALHLLAEVCGTERLVYGTNFGGWDQGGAMDLGDLDAPIRDNTARLLRLG